jgi:hypothetical protein
MRDRRRSKIISNLIISIWIGTVGSIDLLLSWISLIIRIGISLNESGYYRKDTPYAVPIHEVIFSQFYLSIGCLCIGFVWSGILIIISERLLFLLKFPKYQDRRFHSLTLKLVGFTMGMIVVAIAIGNGWIAVDQIRGRERFEHNLKWIDGVDPR